jgi:hypothetical protein
VGSRIGSIKGYYPKKMQEDRQNIIMKRLYRDSVKRFFASGFFLESVSPKPLIIPIGPFRIFSKIAEIFAAQGLPPVSTTPVAMEK